MPDGQEPLQREQLAAVGGVGDAVEVVVGALGASHQVGVLRESELGHRLTAGLVRSRAYPLDSRLDLKKNEV